MSDALQQGVAAARAGRRAEARALLTQAIREGERGADAWLWLAGVLDDPAQIRECLEHALALEPGNTRAQQGLAWLAGRDPARQEQAPSELAAATGSETRLSIASHAPALAEPHALEPQREPEAPPPSSPSTAPQPQPSSFNEPPCPFCGATAPALGRRCPSCANTLLVRAARPRRRGRLWLLVCLVLTGAAVWMLSQPAGLAVIAAYGPLAPALVLAGLLGLGLLVLVYPTLFGPIERLSHVVQEGDAQAHYTRGVALRERGMWYAAAQEWESAVQQAPRNPQFLHALGLAYTQVRQFEQARAALDTALQLAPASAELRESRALVDQLAGARP